MQSSSSSSSSSVTRETNNAFNILSKVSNLTCDSTPNRLSLDGYSSVLSNVNRDRIYVNLWAIGRSNKSSKIVGSLSLGGKGVSRVSKFFNEFNKFIRFHCDKIPLGFASVKANSGSDCRLGGENGGVLEDGTLPLGGYECNGKKKVLILMSDTGGGHRASAEAIKWAFNEKFGDDYEVFVTDLWTDHTPWPFNQLPRSYNFLVKHGSLWRMTYYASAPRLVHQSNFAATSTFIAREVAKGLMKYQPDIIISVHPLMQHVPLRILRSKGLLDKIVFTTVVTDLSTCHPTWFHKLVTRCYCPTEEVAKRALKAGLQPSQIKVYGLPVRPSFVKPLRPKV